MERSSPGARLSKSVDIGDTLQKCDSSVGYFEGDNIVVTYGPLVGMEGSIKRIDRHKRLALVEMDMFDRVTEVKVGLEIIEKK